MSRTCLAKPKCAARITQMAENVVALAQAPKGEDYSGPVLFEGAAGPQIFAEVLAKNLALTRRPVGEAGAAAVRRTSEFEGRMGARVLPDTFDVVDDPTQKEWRGRPLFGSYDGGPRRRRAQAAAPGGKGRPEGLPADPPAGARIRRLERARAPAR